MFRERPGQRHVYEGNNGIGIKREVQRFSFSNGKAMVYELTPKNAGPVPVVLIQGFGIDNPRERKMKVIARAGHRVIAIHPLRLDGLRLNQDDANGSENNRKASIYLNTLEKMGVDKAKFIVISGGAPSALIAAIKNPSIVDRMVLVTPVGLNGPVGKGRLGWRFINKDANTKELPLREKSQAVLELAALLASPKRTASEVSDMAGTDTYALCLKAAENGTKISVILAEQDNLFPLSEIQENIKRFGDVPSPFFEIKLVEGGHDENSCLHPVRVELAVKILNRMKKD